MTVDDPSVHNSIIVAGVVKNECHELRAHVNIHECGATGETGTASTEHQDVCFLSFMLTSVCIFNVLV